MLSAGALGGGHCRATLVRRTQAVVEKFVDEFEKQPPVSRCPSIGYAVQIPDTRCRM